MQIKVAITDDHPLVIVGLKQMLAPYQHITIEAIYASGDALLKGLQSTIPDILLLDIWLPDKRGNELAKIIHQKYPSIRIIILSSIDNAYYIKDALKNGCLGYLPKNSDPSCLLEAIERVYLNEQYIEPSIREEILSDLPTGKKQHSQSSPILTRREKEVLQLIAAELSNQEIASKLLLSEAAVENHRKSLLHKLDIKNSVALTEVALKYGLA